MKRMIILAAMICVLSCAKEEVTITGELVEKSFMASFEEPTKTSIDVTGKVDWSKDDVINYYTASNGTINTYEVPISGHSISFTASVGSDDSFIIAAYGGTISSPQAKSMTLTGAVPSVQSGKFEDAHVSVCKRYFENGNTLNFKNVTSLIKFSLTRTDVSYVTFTANDGTKIHGNGSLYFSFSGESISSVKFSDSEGGNSIQVNTGGSGTFYVSTLPCSIDGFTLTYYDSSDHILGSTKTSKTLILGTGKIINLGILDERIDESPVENVSLNYSQKQMGKGHSCQLVISVSPIDAVIHSIEWSSDNENIAKVSSTGLVTAIEYGSCTISVTVNSTKSATCSVEVVEAIDLSSKETANCYLVSESGMTYKFKATVKGNTNESLGTPKKVNVLWESFGTNVAPQIEDVVSAVSLDGDYVRFTSGQNGNAVIAVKDQDGDILWSWHIWVCNNYNPNTTLQTYKNNAGNMMDRNLGATSAIPGDVHSLGLIYQWGRKDPFIGGCQISYLTVLEQQEQAKSTGEWPSATESSATTGTLEYVDRHPMQFITTNNNNYDWYYTETSSTDNTRWYSSKGKYDPCPPGWRVPDGGNSGIWSTAFGTSSSWTTSSNWDDTNKGMNFGETDIKLATGTSWYPAAGGINLGSGLIYAVGFNGMYWSCTPNGCWAHYLSFGTYGSIDPSARDSRAHGRSLRCQQVN